VKPSRRKNPELPGLRLRLRRRIRGRLRRIIGMHQSTGRHHDRLMIEETPFIQAIRNNVIVLITPVVETDGREKQVDSYYYGKKTGKQRPSLVYWGKYVAHDNNRDGMGQLLKLFGIEIEGCARCGGKLKILASIEEPQVIAKILWHLQRTAPEQYPSQLPLGARAPPVQASLL
jgi:hypothetical protein